MWLYPNWAAAKACRKLGVPYVCFPHGMLEPWSIFGQGVWKDLKKRAYWTLREESVFANAAALFFTTDRERRLAGMTFPLPLNSHIVVPYGIDAAVIGHGEAGPAALPVDGPYALFLGRVHPKKNVEFLVEAWAEAAPPVEWRLVIAGPGDPGYLAQVKGLVQRLGLSERVVFAGMVAGEKKRALFQNARWFLLPSSQENFGIAVLEAVSSGCPVAISDQVYLADYFHGESEVMPVAKADWVRFLQERMVDEGWRQRVIARDREELVPRFRFETVVRDWVETLERVFG
jgi:glycosyltransferase involved in cell wall biosynthesis